MAQSPDERAFRSWYADQAREHDLNPDPDSQPYDYRAAFRAGATPDATGHWPSDFKKAGHPNEIVGGFNTRTGQRAPGTTQASRDDLVRLGWDSATADRLSASPMPQEYTVKNAETGQIITFRWTDPDPPTDADLEEVFAAAKAPDFRASNDKDAAGNATVRDGLSRWLDFLPAATGTAGGVLGGLGGAAFGMGFGGIPGAAGGATLGGGAGEALRQLIERTRGKASPETATDAALGIGTQGAIQGLMEAGGGLAMKGLGAGAKAVYRGYLKPSLAKNVVGKADDIVRTALDEALPITKAGRGRANQVIKDLRTEVDGILANTSGNVDLAAVAGKVRAFAKAKYFKPGQSMDSYEQALKVADTIDAHPSLNLPPPAMPRSRVGLPEANTIKRNLQEGVGATQYGIPSKAGKAAEKLGAREMRLGIERLAPSVGPLNARESKLIDVAKAINQAVGREGNQSAVVGVKTLASGVAGGEAYRRTGDPYAAAVTALAGRLALTPAVASRAAIVAYRLGKTSGVVPATAARLAIAAVSSPKTEQPSRKTQP